MIKISETKGSDWLKQTSILSQALPFMQRYAGKNITIKYGGSAMGEDKLSSSLSPSFIIFSNDPEADAKVCFLFQLYDRVLCRINFYTQRFELAGCFNCNEVLNRIRSFRESR